VSNPKIFSIPASISFKTRIAPLSTLFAALICIVALATATTPAHAQAVNFGSINVCPAGKTTPTPCNATETVTFSIPAGTTISSIPILTTGIADLDFKAKADDTSTTLCKAQTYSSATTCTVDVTFAPLAAGLRKGAVELLNGTAVVAKDYVYGDGVGPVLAFSPWPRIGIDSGTNGVSGLALDAKGNIFVTNESASTVTEILAEGGYTTSKTLGGGFIGPIGVTVDGGGNVIVASSGITTQSTYSSNVKMIPASCIDGPNDASCVKTLGGGFHYARSVAVDGAGNVFVTDYQHFYVKEIPASCIAGENDISCTVKINVIPYGPGGVAVDAIGDVFFFGDNLLYEILAINGSIPPNPGIKLLSRNLFNPYGIAVDASGNAFIADPSKGIFEFIAAGGYATTKTIDSNGFEAVAVDPTGNIFLANPFARQIDVLQRSLPPVLTFASSNLGSTSSDSPQSATLQNVGNATLIGSPVLTDTTDFSLVSGPDTPPSCGGSFSLAPSVECNVNVNFTPQSAELLTGTLVLTDNTGNQTDATQYIDLSGSGTGAAVAQVTPTTLQFGNIPYTRSATQPLTITNIGKGTLTVNPSSNGRGTIITGNTCGAGLGAGKSCTLQVDFTALQIGVNANTLTIGTNGPSNPTVSVLGTGIGVGSEYSSVDFGTVVGRGNVSYGEIVLVNYGVPGTVTVATETGATTFHVTDNTCTAGVTADNNCSVFVTFAPVSTGPETAYLKLIPSTGPTQIIALTGTLVP